MSHQPQKGNSRPARAHPGHQLTAFLAKPRIVLPLAVLAAVAIAALLGPILSPYRYDEVTGNTFSAPSLQHWCGTDNLGRDVLTLTLHGARISLLVGFLGAVLSLLIGVTWGCLAGYLGGAWDSVLMRIVDVLFSVPRLILVIVVLGFLDGYSRQWLAAANLSELGPYARLGILLIGLGAVQWLTMARVIRGQVLSLREREFVKASLLLGQSHFKVILRHILPNLGGIILVYLTLTIPVVILEESLLSFLGLGVQPPIASWGTLISLGAQNINPLNSFFWLLATPAAFMAVTLLSLNFLGDGLRDALDPRTDKK